MGVEVWIEYRKIAIELDWRGTNGLRNIYIWIGGEV